MLRVKLQDTPLALHWVQPRNFPHGPWRGTRAPTRQLGHTGWRWPHFELEQENVSCPRTRAPDSHSGHSSAMDSQSG